MSMPSGFDCRALLFDMDGLMVDSEPVWYALQSEFVRARGGVWTPELAARCVGGGLANTLRVMEQTFGFPVDLERDAEAMVQVFLARVGDMELKPGCRELAQAAGDAGKACAVASSSTNRLVEATLGHFGLRSRFQSVVTGDRVTRPKPFPDIFLEAARELGAAPTECIVLEDSLAGVRAARAAGMRVIAVPEKNPRAFEDLASAVVGDLHAARGLLAI